MPFDPAVMILPLVIILILLVIYYIFLVRIILQMLRIDANPVLMVFSFLALLPLPFTILLGILIMIIWKLHRKNLPEFKV